MFNPPEPIQTEVFARLPEALRIKGRMTPWQQGRQRGEVDCFLEGPSVARNGDIYCTDIAHGRILKVTQDGTFHVVAEYDGEPNGLKIHRDGRLFVADHRRGILAIDPSSGVVTPILERAFAEGFRGPNDLFFSKTGDLYFTDQGQSGYQDPSGRVYNLAAGGTLTLVLDGIPSPNGLALSLDERTLFVNVTRANAVWRVPLMPDGRVTKVGTFLQLSGGSGPDGLAVDEEGGLVVAHPGLGSVWRFSPQGEPTHRVRSCLGWSTTNIAFGNGDRRSLFITESASGSILVARMPVAGQLMFAAAPEPEPRGRAAQRDESGSNPTTLITGDRRCP